MKRVLSIFICVLLLLPSSMSVIAATDFTVSITADKSSAAVGEEVTLTVKLTNTEASRSGSISVAVGDGLEIVSGEMLASGATLKSFDIATQKGVVAFGEAVSFNGDFAKIVVKVKSTESKTVTVTVNLKPSNSEKTATYSVQSSTAATAAKATIDSKTANADDTIVLNVTLSDAPKIKSLAVSDVTYDASALELTNAEWKVANTTLASWDSSTGKGAAAFTEEKDINGVILALTFKVKSAASNNEYPVSLTVTAKDAKSAPIPVETVASSITIENSGTPVSSSAKATIDLKTAKPGDTVQVNVTLSDAPKIKSIAISDVSFNSSAIELKNAEWKVANTTLASWDASKGKGAAALTEERDINGIIFALTFQVKSGVGSGDYPISLTVTAKNAKNTIIPVEIQAGGIKVGGSSVSVTGVSLNKSTLSMKTGDTTKLTANVSPTNATNKSVTWSTNNSSVASVYSDGTVTAIKQGNATITVKTSDGGFTASCAVTVECAHTNKLVTNAKDSTCQEQGNDTYYTCSDCGQLFASDQTTEIDQPPFRPLLPHRGGTATCTHRAVCSMCGNEYGDYGSHNYSAQIKNASTQITVGTCRDAATYYYSCSVCSTCERNSSHYFTGDLNSSNHTGGTRIVNQKIATCYEEGYTGDTYCNGCNTLLARGSTIAKSAHNPATVWSSDSNYHWHVCQNAGCTEQLDKAAHSGGEATCISKAKCETCGAEYGLLNPNNHKHTEIRNARAATEESTGYTGDVYCTDCKKVVESGTVIPKLDHTHRLVATPAKDATCTEAGNLAYWFCEKCGKYYADADATRETTLTAMVLQPLRHNYVAVVTAPTCTTGGYTTHTCSRCGDSYVSDEVSALNHNPASTWSSDGQYHWHACQNAGCTAQLNKTAHSGGEATCSAKAKCEVCGAEYGSLNPNNHKHTEVRNARAATETSTGYSGDTYCADCEILLVRGTTVPKLDHTHELTATPEKAATCGTAGNIAYWYCEKCGKYYADAEAAIEVSLEDTVIAALGHNFGAWIETTPATCTAAGEETKYCLRCTATLTHSIPALGHNYIFVVTAPTCTEAGYTTHTCSRCKDSYTSNEVSALGHDFGDWTLTTAPTCTAAGEETHYCSRCDATETRAVAPLGHSLTHVAAVEATKAADGNIEYWKCAVCGKYFSDANGEHEITADSVIIKYVPLLGDVNEDGKINARDIIAIMRYLTGWEDNDFNVTVADFDGNGRVNARDVIAIMKSIVSQ